MVEGIREAVRAFGQRYVELTLGVLGIVITLVTAETSQTAAAIVGALIFSALVILVVWGLYVRVRFGGVYEVLEHVNEWDIFDPTGARVTHSKQLKAKLIQDDVTSVYDYVWGQGDDLLKDYDCSPYRAVDDFDYPGGQRYVLISFREKKARNSPLDLNISRTVVDGFLSDSEWAEVGAFEITRKLVLRVKFPARRPPTSHKLLRVRRGRESTLAAVQPTFTPEGRAVLEYPKKRPRRGDIYRFVWTWDRPQPHEPAAES